MSIDPYRSARALLLAGALFAAGCGGDRPSESGAKGRGGDSQKTGASGAAATTGGAVDSTAGVAPAAAAAAFTQGTPVVDSTRRFDFSLRPKKGDRFQYRLRTDAETNLSGKTMQETSVYNFTVDVTGINDDGSMTVEMTHDSIRIRRSYAAGLVDSVARTIAFDSRRPDTSLAGTEQYRALIGRRVNLTLGRDGQVREVSNVDPVLNAIVGNQREKVSPKQWEQLRMVVKLQAFSAIFEQMFLQGAPDSTVAPGATWSRTYNVPVLGIASKNTVHYRLAEVRQVGGRPLGLVAMDLKTQFLEKKIDNEMISATADEMKADGGGELLVQLDNGWPARKSTTIEMRIAMTGTAKVGPEKGKSKSLSQSVKTRTLVELLRFTAGG